MYLCEVAIVSQLCISFPYVLHGLCEDYLACDIAFNAVMPLSRASTRERYSRIEGVTKRRRANCFSPFEVGFSRRRLHGLALAGHPHKRHPVDARSFNLWWMLH